MKRTRVVGGIIRAFFFTSKTGCQTIPSFVLVGLSRPQAQECRECKPLSVSKLLVHDANSSCPLKRAAASRKHRKAEERLRFDGDVETGVYLPVAIRAFDHPCFLDSRFSGGAAAANATRDYTTGSGRRRRSIALAPAHTQMAPALRRSRARRRAVAEVFLAASPPWWVDRLGGAVVAVF